MHVRSINNERKACDAIARVLEEHLDGARTNPRCPEEDGIGEPVDYVFDLAGQTYAIEHTIIEAFERQIHTGVDFEALVNPITEALDGQMPRPGMYRLVFPIDPCSGLKPRDIPKCQETVIAWVREKAAKLHAENPRPANPYGKVHFVKETPPGLNFELCLSHDTMHGLTDGRLFVSRFAPDDYQDLRIKRMITAFDRKLPKLAAWKTDGAISILALENRDIALTNHLSVAEAVEKAVRTKNDRPDQVWLVDTCIKEPWTVWCLLRGDMIFPDGETAFKYREFKPDALYEV